MTADLSGRLGPAGGWRATADLDAYDARIARGATGVLREFNAAGVLSAADVHVALRLSRLGGEEDERVLLAAALAVRGVRLGSVCLDLGRVRHTVTVDDPEDSTDLSGLPWPAEAQWAAACSLSPLVAVGLAGDPARPLRFIDGLLYLDRYWRQEESVRAELDARAARTPPPVDPIRLRQALERLFPDPPPDRQRLAAATCAVRWVTVLAGGPGTGKTTTVAKVLALLHDTVGPPPRIALAAPTGKAAARLQEAVHRAATDITGGDWLEDVTASTLHRLLGSRPDTRSRFRHDRHNRLPYDVVVVDETSMVSLTMMSRLLEAVRPDARLVLVGDPDQLASVEAGAVLGDLVARPVPNAGDAAVRQLVAPADLSSDADAARGVVRLVKTWRFDGVIAELSAAVRDGDADAAIALLRSGAPGLAFVESDTITSRVPAGVEGLREDTVAAARDLTRAARAGAADEALALLDRHRLICAHRQGPYGVTRWGAEVAAWLTAAIPAYAAEGRWYAGRPLLVTANDYEAKLYNGDAGVVVTSGEGGLVAAFGRGGAPVLLQPTRLSAVETVHAMTVHRSQGSQFQRVSVLLPPPESPLLTRELLYTAVTRATDFVRVIGTEEAVRAAVARPVVRASGLRLPR